MRSIYTVLISYFLTVCNSFAAEKASQYINVNNSDYIGSSLVKELINLINGDSSLFKILGAILNTLWQVWNYTIYTTTDKQPITLANVVIGLILFVLGLRFARYLSNITREKLLNVIKLESNVKDALEKISHYLYIVFITLVVLDISHVPLTVFTFVGGALAISVGLGSQNILNNFISGLMIMVEQPIRVGDYVEVNNMIGRVISIGARCINIRTSSNIDILVPNSMLLQNTIVNWTLHDNTVRVTINVPIDSKAPTRKVEKLLLDVLEPNPDILKFPEPQVFFHSISEYGLKYEVNFWVSLSSSTERKRITSEINHLIRETLTANNIPLALHFGFAQT